MKFGICTNLAKLALGTVVAFTLSTAASARDVVLPAGTILQCVLNEPNFSTASVELGDPVLCHLREVTEFGEQVFPRGSYLVGHLESAKDPGHFFGKGNLKLQFDRMGLPSGDFPVNAKIIAVRGYKVDREGKIDGKGHAKRDVAEWMFPPLWPWKVVALPSRGPRPKLKGETALSLRLLDDVQIPTFAQTYGRQSNFFRPQSFRESEPATQRPALRTLPSREQLPPCARTFGPGWHFFGQPPCVYTPEPGRGSPKPATPDLPSTDQTAIDAPENSSALYVPESSRPAGQVPAGVSVFVMKSGALLAVGDCVYQNGRVVYDLPGGGNAVISAYAVDWSTTLRVNAERGLRLTLRGTNQRGFTQLGWSTDER
jgi:hypothetical protein